MCVHCLGTQVPLTFTDIPPTPSPPSLMEMTRGTKFCSDMTSGLACPTCITSKGPEEEQSARTEKPLQHFKLSSQKG